MIFRTRARADGRRRPVRTSASAVAHDRAIRAAPREEIPWSADTQVWSWALSVAYVGYSPHSSNLR
ncbi:hypothetical protein ABTX77_38470 [Streptomyces sp. NPDC097704]|uniref:hypothetical protein n=1 Tax=Streptomyces sp. NPDC097704 TaxID=3157101 RepID=UPI0033236D3B